jgi:hypothetical protein
MGYSGSGSFAPDADGSVLREVADFFTQHPFLLVDEKRLAVLLCRPLKMICDSVRALENAGFLIRKDEGTLICMATEMAKLSSE